MKKTNGVNVYKVIEDCVNGLLEKKHHAVYEHEHKTDEQLKNRCACENITGASCFNEGENVTDLIIDIIYDSGTLTTWVGNNSIKTDLRLVIPMEKCGKKFLKNRSHDWSLGALECSSVIVEFGKNFDMAGGLTNIYMTTCFPQ